MKDVQSLTSSTTVSQYQFGRSYGPLPQNDMSLGHSVFEQTHRLVFAGSYTFPTTGTDLSMVYVGESGQRFHFTYGGSLNGDLNGDGVGNDLIYVPKDVRDSNEIIFVPNGGASIAKQQDAFQAFINAHQCLKHQVGTIMERNSCQEPFHHTINFTVAQRVGGLLGGIWKGARTSELNNLQFRLDVFNLANLINGAWGRQQFAGFGAISLLQYSSKEAGSLIGPNGARPKFTFSPTTPFTDANNAESNYRLQLSVRYSF